MKPTETYIDEICNFLMLNRNDFVSALDFLRDKKWERWGGGTVEVTVAEILYVVAKLKNPNRVFEGGTNCGYSTAHLAEALKDCSKEPASHMITVDADQALINLACSYLYAKDIDLEPIRDDSVESIKKVSGLLDLVFIDTSHTYEHTVKEWEALLPHLGEKSVVLFHDAYTDACGVKKFLKEIEETNSWRVLVLDTQPNTGLGIVAQNREQR